MELTGIHFLLTYQCNFECDHCFVWGSPFAKGTFRLRDIRRIYREVRKLDTVEWVYFEGGEPFLYYPIMVRALSEAKRLGFKIGIVSCPYWATSVRDALEWLRPIAEIGLDDLSLSSDLYHWQSIKSDEMKAAIKAGKKLGLPVSIISIKRPLETRKVPTSLHGVEVGYWELMYRGRAVAKLLDQAPRKPWTEFTKCPYEDLGNPSRIHLDPFGYIHICQGLCIGNAWKKPFSEIVNSYAPFSNPIARPLLNGGPAALVKEFDLPHEETYADACHLCYVARLQLRSRFPEVLSPGQMYGEGLQ
jgi:MoaA/NifB/PqqE/SkfB family radical SAM enzyme